MLGNMISEKAVPYAVRVSSFNGAAIVDNTGMIILDAVPAVQLGVHS